MEFPLLIPLPWTPCFCKEIFLLWDHRRSTDMRYISLRCHICQPSEWHIRYMRWHMWVMYDWYLSHWGRVTHICVSELTIIGWDNGLSPGRRQAIISTNDGILIIGPLGTNLHEILFGIETFSFNKMHLKRSSAKWRPFCLGLNELIYIYWNQ